MMPVYEHTQKGPWYLLLLAVAASQITTLATGAVNGTPWVFWLLAAVSILMIALAFSFRSLTVLVTKTEIRVRFGPLPLMGKRVSLRDVHGVEAARSTFLDGWGVHWNPGHGWIYNLWGFDCIALDLGKNRLRIGTDEPLELLQAIQREILATRESKTLTSSTDGF
jgi:hypothetical protein